MVLGEEINRGIEIAGIINAAVAWTAPSGVQENPSAIHISGIPGMAVTTGPAMYADRGNFRSLEKRSGQISKAAAHRFSADQYVVRCCSGCAGITPEIGVIIGNILGYPLVDGFGLVIIAGQPRGDLLRLRSDGIAADGEITLRVAQLVDGCLVGCHRFRVSRTGNVLDLLQIGHIAPKAAPEVAFIQFL